MSRASISRPRRLTIRQREAIAGVLIASPWMFGVLVFVAGPIIASAVLSLTSWNILTPPRWIGLANYGEALANGSLTRYSLLITTEYAFFAVPLQIICGLFLALMLNQKIRLRSVFRTVYYLPSVLSGVAVAILWEWLFNTQFGMINIVLRSIGIPGPGWLTRGAWVIPAFVLMSVWQVGGSMLINLAGLQGIPTDLYEAAVVDGATGPRSFLAITLPMMSPVLLFNTIMGVIAALQVFTFPYVMTGGGPHNASMFVMLILYQNAFNFFKMGYASALAWILFVYIMALTLLVIRSSGAWVYYESSLKGR